MSRHDIEQLRHIQTFNRGFWLSARIYSDQRGGCACGGQFNAREFFKKLEYPVCNKCGEDPKTFRVRAKVVTPDMEEKYIDVRHFNRERLTDIVDVFQALKQINFEVENGTFDLHKYDSKDSRERFVFENYLAKYMSFHEARLKAGELSPSAIANKKTAHNHLMKVFKGVDISTIKRRHIEEFRATMPNTPRARDLALAELKAILNHARDISEMPVKPPKFEMVNSSRKRAEIISLDTARKVIRAVEDDQYKIMLTLLTIYPVRPGELRALQWKDIYNNEVYFRRHFSRDVLIDGRKSIKNGEKSEVKFPVVKELTDYMKSIPRPINEASFIFTGKKQAFVSDHCLSRAWRDATRLLRLPDHDLYEMRHARLTEIMEDSNGNMAIGLRVSGHTNPKTFMERYVRDRSDLAEYFN